MRSGSHTQPLIYCVHIGTEGRGAVFPGHAVLDLGEVEQYRIAQLLKHTKHVEEGWSHAEWQLITLTCETPLRYHYKLCRPVHLWRINADGAVPSLHAGTRNATHMRSAVLKALQHSAVHS